MIKGDKLKMKSVLCERVFRLTIEKQNKELWSIISKQANLLSKAHGSFIYKGNEYNEYLDVIVPRKRKLSRLHPTLHERMNAYLAVDRTYKIDRALIGTYFNAVLNASNSPDDWAATLPAIMRNTIEWHYALENNGTCFTHVNERYEEYLTKLQVYLMMTMLEN